MTADTFFWNTPLWVVSILLFLAMAAAREAGVWARRRAGFAKAVSTGNESYILSAVLGLLALLVAFSFGMALDRYDARCKLVVSEANALSTAWQRTALFDHPGQLRGLLLEYADARLAYGLTGGEAQELAAQKAEQLQPQIWNEAVHLIEPSRQTPLPAFTLSPLSDAFDYAQARKAALQAHMPALVLSVLTIYFIAAALVLGYATAQIAKRDRVILLSLFALFALVLGVILDLDRPREGLIPIPQGAMTDTVQMMHAQFDAANSPQ
ncbi:MAG: hypothetical protein LBE24_06590 [Methylobacillus sp.]|jgi:hypothetical protein|nr:hypothetical protein [Methylobacillus sp.]